MTEVLNNLTNTAQYFVELFYTSPIAIYTCDQNGYINFYNKSATVLWGRIPEVGKDLWCGSWKIYYPDGKPMALDECPMALTLKQGKAYEGREIVIERPDHSFRYLLVYPRPLFDSENNMIGAHNTLVDISEQKSGEHKQAILSAIVESSDDVIISKTLEGKIMSWNKGAQKIFGYSEEEMIGKPINILIPPNLQQEEEVILQNIKAGNKIDHFQTIRLGKMGNEIPVSITVSPVKDKQGNIIGASKIARDISEQLQKEYTINQAARRLQMLNSIGKAISEKLDVESILQRVTDATTQITGASLGAFFFNKTHTNGENFTLLTSTGIQKEYLEKLGNLNEIESLSRLFHSKDILRVEDITKLPADDINSLHYKILQENLPVVSYMTVPVIANCGKVIGRLFLGHSSPGMFKTEHEDILASIASQASVALENSTLFEEAKVLNAKKDEFIALASHELKTPLTTAKGYLQILQKTELDKVSKLFVEKVLDQVERLNTLTSDLFDISKIEAGKLQLNYETFDLRKLVLDLMETFHYSLSTHKMVLQVIGHPLLVEADKQRIEQVIINLVNNAVKYSPNAHSVYIDLIREDNQVTVKIKDTGIGLEVEQQNKIFSKFYRANGNVNIPGLGLGLFLSREIIKQHHGTISVKSEMGKGSEFFFIIPVKKQNKKDYVIKSS